MDPIKEAFSRAKQDIQILKEQFIVLTNELLELKSILKSLKDQQTNKQIIQQIDFPTHNPSQNIEEPTDLTEPIDSSTHNPTEEYAYKALKPHIYRLSTGNDGVPTNKPTNQQTNQHPNISSGESNIEDLSKLLNSLDTIKKELRHKFKRLSKQEMLVFSVLYQLEEEGFDVDYPLIAKKLSLSESSIRDYIQRILKKGIPIQKIKENNKKIYLKVSLDLKKIASLETLLQLREI